MRRDKERGQGMAEAALAIPAVLLLVFALINLTILGYASVAASNAANYGARVGSVYQTGAAAQAASAAQQAADSAMIGQYSVAAAGGGQPGSQVVVAVQYRVPNFMGGIVGLFGGSTPTEFTGVARAYFRQEGY